MALSTEPDSNTRVLPKLKGTVISFLLPKYTSGIGSNKVEPGSGRFSSQDSVTLGPSNSTFNFYEEFRQTLNPYIKGTIIKERDIGTLLTSRIKRVAPVSELLMQNPGDKSVQAKLDLGKMKTEKAAISRSESQTQTEDKICQCARPRSSKETLGFKLSSNYTITGVISNFSQPVDIGRCLCSRHNSLVVSAY